MDTGMGLTEMGLSFLSLAYGCWSGIYILELNTFF